MKIQYYIKNVYGVEQWYTADEKMRKALQEITCHTTIRPYIVKPLEELGFTFEQVLPPKQSTIKQ